MTAEDIKKICLHFPGATQDLKWGDHLVFSVGGKMFSVVGLDQSPTTSSFKVSDDAFDEVSNRMHFKPAPYLARHKWVLIEDTTKMNPQEWAEFLRQSYELVKAKLPAKIRKQIDG